MAAAELVRIRDDGDPRLVVNDPSNGFFEADVELVGQRLDQRDVPTLEELVAALEFLVLVVVAERDPLRRPGVVELGQQLLEGEGRQPPLLALEIFLVEVVLDGVRHRGIRRQGLDQVRQLALEGGQRQHELPGDVETRSTLCVVHRPQAETARRVGKAQRLAELGHGIADGPMEEHGAHLHQRAVEFTRPCTTSDPIARFEDQDLQIRIVEGPRGGQTRDSRAHHDDGARSLRARRSRPRRRGARASSQPEKTDADDEDVHELSTTSECSPGQGLTSTVTCARQAMSARRSL